VLAVLLLGLAGAAVSANPARAQQASETEFTEMLRNYNLSPPALNPRFQQPNWFLNRSVLDNTKTVIGRVEDILIGGNGMVQQVVADVDIPRSPRQLMYFDLGMVSRQPVSNMYELSVHRQTIADRMPDFLQRIETAAGNGMSEVFSLRRAMDGAELRDSRGRKLGDVRQIFLSDSGQFIQALLVTNITGASSRVELALPYDGSMLDVGERSGRVGFYLAEPYDQALRDYARSRRR